MTILGNYNKYIAQTITIGMVLSGLALLLMIIIGFIAAIYTTGHSTEFAMKTVYIYTVPYVFYAVLGYYLCSVKKSRVINSTFNIGALALVVMWAGVIVRASSATFLSPDLSLMVVDNFTSSAMVVGLMGGLLLLESYMIH